MASLVHTLFYFAIALGVLIAFHEFGHFWAARRLGVKVLRFSLGFGKPLLRYRKRPDDTEFIVSALPLGGYVKMADEREGEVAAKDLPHAFNRQRLPVRFAIVLAGPLFNLLLAVLIYWSIYLVGETGMRPVLGPVEKESLAAQAGFEAGDEILSIDQTSTPTWNLAMSTLFERVMDEEKLSVEVQTADGQREHKTLTIPENIARQPELLADRLGFRPFEPNLAPVVDKVEPGSPADQAGLSKGDLLISVNGQTINDWAQWVEYVRAHPGEDLKVEIERNGARSWVQLRPATVTVGGEKIGRIGASALIPEDFLQSMQVEYRLGLFPALGAAVTKTYDYSVLTLKMIGRMLTGNAAIENLSGPISIAQYAGQSARLGFMQFLKFLAIVSISLGVLNLLPIPVLDGGHLLFYVVEAIKGSPLSEHTQAIWQQIGMALLLCLMSLAFIMDIERLFD
jgi:regulator of sigma E protease